MEMTGRLTANAVIATVQGIDRQVINFTIALNDTFKVKGTGEIKEYVTFIDCAYWLGTGVAKLLTKGSLVTVIGRLTPNAYLDRQGQPKGGIRCHTDRIKIHQSVKQPVAPPAPADLTEPLDDLPF